MGTKPGKHAREASEEGEGSDEAPLPKKSPKSSTSGGPSTSSKKSPKGRKSSKSSKGGGTTPETSPVHRASQIPAGPDTGQPAGEGGGGGGLSGSEKENQEGLAPPATPPSSRKGDHQLVEEETVVPSQLTPVRMERELEPLTPLVIQDSQDMSVMAKHRPQATSTPAATANGRLSSPPLSPDSGTDQSDDEAFSHSDQQPPSPSASFNSTSTNSTYNRRSHSDSVDSRRSEPNFGRFYNTSYLGLNSGQAARGRRMPPKQQSPAGSHFHRPPNFTYSKEPPTFMKKKGTGMSALTNVKRVVKVRRSSSPADLKNQEAVRMSMFPSAKPKQLDELDKIERDDWPGPASPAAILPEILRQRRRSRGERDEDDDEEEVKEDPRITRELYEISKIKDESGIGQVIYRELEGLKAKPHQPLDPWKASRAPSAKFEPRYRTRFQSPMFASPSRFVDRPRYAWDDSDIRTYRSASTLANLPTPKPGYGPSYGPRAATLPLAGAWGARDDFRYFDFDESDDRHERSAYNSSSTLTGEGSRRHDSSFTGYEGPTIPLLKLQKSTWHAEIEPMIYPYEKLKITNFDLPKEVDTNHLEIHLDNEEFEELFKMPRERFYRMAEWKRNDVKRKVDLY